MYNYKCNANKNVWYTEKVASQKINYVFQIVDSFIIIYNRIRSYISNDDATHGNSPIFSSSYHKKIFWEKNY